jgi:hypothetical protein
MPTDSGICFSGALISLATVVLTGLGATVAKVHFHLMAAKQAQLADMAEQRDLYARMTHEALTIIENTIHERRQPGKSRDPRRS